VTVPKVLSSDTFYLSFNNLLSISN